MKTNNCYTHSSKTP